MAIRGVIFDLDGTVVKNAYDWPRIREELGNGPRPILSYLCGLEEPERSRKWAILERHEAEQTAQATLREGMRELLAFLEGRGVRTALVTNNSIKNTDHLLRKFDLRFDSVLTRESGLWKPSGAPFREVLGTFGIGGGECGVVGDTRFDVLAALDAGVGTIFILGPDPAPFAGFPVEVVPSLDLVRGRLELLV